MRTHEAGVRELARLYGVQRTYIDTSGRKREAPRDGLLAVLKALGAPLDRAADAPAAVRTRRYELATRLIEPVVTAWDGEAGIDVRLPASRSPRILRCSISLENGEPIEWEAAWADLPIVGSAESESERIEVRRLAPPAPLPPGYHTLTLGLDTDRHECLIISAPQTVEHTSARSWGLFAPTYALRSARDWGAGDFTDLEGLLAWAGGLGASTIATLPFLASFQDEPFGPSPYMPASRLFWNELYVDPDQAPELARCPEAQVLIASAAFQEEMAELRRLPLVDYRRVAALKRRALEPLAQTFFSEGGARDRAFRHFLQEHPLVEDYARFRAAMERRRAPWPAWPSRMREGRIGDDDYDADGARYHVYAQWLAGSQVRELAQRAGERGQTLFLDLPLGIHGHGYDVWRERGLFAAGASAGAPPDAFFALGQNWAFPPLIPERQRDQRYRYLIGALRHQMRYAGMLRVDHVMALHRLYWIPEGEDARHGVYVRYPADELYAILNLESLRHGTRIVGENLGTVPAYVNGAMRRHGFDQMYVAQFAMHPGRRPFGDVPQASAASVNTHDLAPFASYWRGLDIERQVRSGHLTEGQAEEARKRLRRTRRDVVADLRANGRMGDGDTAGEALRGILRELAASEAGTLLIALEDLWLETEAQNVPGTVDEHPNWQRKMRYRLDELAGLPGAAGVLPEVGVLRRGRAR